jgi:alkylhydroperoxidase/carboxymuconolactone decarboxylase family protein YurZ
MRLKTLGAQPNSPVLGAATDAALKQGATREEIAEALGVAVAMNAGVALVYSARVSDAYAAKAAPGQP